MEVKRGDFLTPRLQSPPRPSVALEQLVGFCRAPGARGVFAQRRAVLPLVPCMLDPVDEMIGAEHTAVLGATMNTTGQIGSILCPTVTGWVVKEFLNWQVPLIIMGSLYVLSAILWLLVDPRKRLVTGGK